MTAHVPVYSTQHPTVALYNAIPVNCPGPRLRYIQLAIVSAAGEHSPEGSTGAEHDAGADPKDHSPDDPH